MPAISNICPNCKGELTGGGVPHCDNERRDKPCGWIKHRPCGANVDPRKGRFTGGQAAES